jgi:hypothetical protein
MKFAWWHAISIALCSSLVTSAAHAQTHAPEPIVVTSARIGCLDIQKAPNLTALVAKVCDGKGSCNYKAPTPQEYTHEGVKAADL